MCNGWRLWLILGHSGNGGVVVVFEILWVPPPPLVVVVLVDVCGGCLGFM